MQFSVDSTPTGTRGKRIKYFIESFKRLSIMELVAGSTYEISQPYAIKVSIKFIQLEAGRLSDGKHFEAQIDS